MPNAPLIVVNPTAGAGRAGRLLPWIRERLAARPDADLLVTRRPGDARAATASATAAGRDRVIAVGGDGTVQEVVNGLRDAGSGELGIVPVGTGNDLARSLGLPRDPAESWRQAMGSATRAIDLGHATNGSAEARWFAAAAGIGFDAQVAAAMSVRRGWQASRAGYLLTTLSELRRFANRHVTIAVDGELITRDVLLIAIANGAYYGGGMRIAPSAKPDDGHLDLCIVGDISRLTALRELPNLYRGTHVRNPAVTMRTARRIDIDGVAGTLVHLDGEPFGRLPLGVALAPNALRVAASDGAEIA